jgi:hypothetical protein
VRDAVEDRVAGLNAAQTAACHSARARSCAARTTSSTDAGRRANSAKKVAFAVAHRNQLAGAPGTFGNNLTGSNIEMTIGPSIVPTFPGSRHNRRLVAIWASALVRALGIAPIYEPSMSVRAPPASSNVQADIAPCSSASSSPDALRTERSFAARYSASA